METALTRPAIKQPWLSVIRGVWILLALYNLLPGLLRLPAYYRQLVAMNPWPNNGGWTPDNFRAAFTNSGFDPRMVAWLVVIPAVIQMIITVSLGLLIFLRQSHEWMGLLASYCMVGLGGTFAGDRYQFFQSLPSFWHLVAQEVGVLLWLGYLMFMILFPNGKFLPRWMYWVAFSLVLWFIPSEIYTRINGQIPVWFSTIGFPILGLILFGKYRQYRFYASPIERLQIRWFLFAITVWIGFGFITNLYDSAFPIQAQPGSKELIIYTTRVYLSSITGIFVPLSIAGAIFRYRLWDIDLVIRRTLAYTTLTGLLGLVYFGLVTLTQTLFTASSGQQSTLALVISTLVIAALFNPLRRRIQQFIDRRFFRQKYDTAQVLEDFSSAARREVELATLSDNLVNVVQKTIQPEQVSIWLRTVRYKPTEEK